MIETTGDGDTPSVVTSKTGDNQRRRIKRESAQTARLREFFRKRDSQKTIVPCAPANDAVEGYGGRGVRKRHRERERKIIQSEKINFTHKVKHSEELQPGRRGGFPKRDMAVDLTIEVPNKKSG